MFTTHQQIIINNNLFYIIIYESINNSAHCSSCSHTLRKIQGKQKKKEIGALFDAEKKTTTATAPASATTCHSLNTVIAEQIELYIQSNNHSNWLYLEYRLVSFNSNFTWAISLCFIFFPSLAAPSVEIKEMNGKCTGVDEWESDFLGNCCLIMA